MVATGKSKGKGKGTKIFISYRREDASDIAGRIRDWLVQTRRIARDDIFVDVTAILPGADFMDVIDHAISQCRAVIVVISPSWLAQVSSPATSHVRMEAEAALSKGIPVIPVLVGGAKLPGAQQLPEQLRVLLRLNVQPLRHETFDYEMGLVRRALRLGGGLRAGWVAAIAAVLLVALSVGILSHGPADLDNPILAALHPSTAMASATATVITSTATATPTPKPLTAGEIVARSRSAGYRDMSGKESRTYSGGYTARGTIVLTLNPARTEEVPSKFDSQGNLIEIDDVIQDGTKRNQHITDERTNPPTDYGWKLDSQPVPDPRPWSVSLLDPYTSATTLDGTEALNDVSTYYLQIQLAATSKYEVWIRTDNIYLVQLFDTEGSVQALAITLSTWDSGLSIAVPSV